MMPCFLPSRLLLLSLAVVLLAACGQKGPLYMPDQQHDQQQAPQQQQQQ
jgi:predicted small lipoprotein YifL